jgi:nitrate reductase beta subunit
VVEDVMKKLIALRQYMRQQNLGEPSSEKILQGVSLNKEAAARLHRLFAIGGYNERNVIPPRQREEQDSARRKGGKGFGIMVKPKGGV